MQLANFYGARSGGLRTAVDRWGAGYVAAGHEVILVVPGQHDHSETLPSGVHRVSVRAPRLPMSGGYRVVSARRVTDVLRGLRPDALEVSDRLTLRGLGRWARKRDVHSTMVSHERLDRLLGIALPLGIARSIADEANQRTAESFDAVVCTTPFAAVEFERIGATNLHRAPLGVDLDLFDPQRADPALWSRYADDTTTLITHCGRLSPEKQAGRSIAAIARLHAAHRRVHLVVAGDGPLRPAMQRAARGLPVTFLGHLTDRREVATLLATTEITLAPGPHETFCLSALESLASGTPVVASESSAVAGLVDATCGALASNTAAGFADGIEQVLEIPRPQREEAARRRATRYRWPDSVAKMLSIHRGDDIAVSGPTTP